MTNDAHRMKIGDDHLMGNVTNDRLLINHLRLCKKKHVFRGRSWLTTLKVVEESREEKFSNFKLLGEKIAQFFDKII